jgi:hypothetical protein
LEDRVLAARTTVRGDQAGNRTREAGFAGQLERQSTWSWREGRDSNPRTLTGHPVSNQARSASLPPSRCCWERRNRTPDARHVTPVFETGYRPFSGAPSGRPRSRTSLAGFGDQPDPRSLPIGPASSVRRPCRWWQELGSNQRYRAGGVGGNRTLVSGLPNRRLPVGRRPRGGDGGLCPRGLSNASRALSWLSYIPRLGRDVESGRRTPLAPLLPPVRLWRWLATATEHALWTRPESNRLPPACKAGALPCELRAQEADCDWRGPAPSFYVSPPASIRDLASLAVSRPFGRGFPSGTLKRPRSRLCLRGENRTPVTLGPDQVANH